MSAGAAGVRVVTLVPGYVDTPLTARNPYPMPFLMTADALRRARLPAIEAGASYRVIPWQMAVVAKLLRLLPNALFDRAAGRARAQARGRALTGDRARRAHEKGHPKAALACRVAGSPGVGSVAAAAPPPPPLLLPP